MNDDQLEQQLRELPEPALPEAWRETILAAARREAKRPAPVRESGPLALLYLRRLFARNPVTAGALAALWLLILVFKAGTPADPASDRLLAHLDPHQPLPFVSLSDEIRLAESWQEEPQPTRIP